MKISADFFEKNTPYRPFVDLAQYARAIDGALTLLEAMRNGSPEQYTAEHKGTPFYVMGYAAFASRDYTSASLYFDAAVAADLIYHKTNNDTPALRFLQLRQTPKEPLLAQEIIDRIASSINTLLDDYRLRIGAKSITLDELRSRFLEKIITDTPEKRSLITAFLSFVAEWPYRARQIELVEAGSREPFFLHILRGCVLFESLLKAAPNTPGSIKTLVEVLRHHGTELGINVGKNYISETDFANILTSLTTGMCTEEAIISCGKARNTIGHNLVWSTTNLTPNAYDILVKNIAASCIHAISKLYR